MASGLENIKSFQAWEATQTDEDFTQIIYRGSLSRTDLAKAVGCGKSAFNQNEGLKKELNSLEDRLRLNGVLPPLTDKAKGDRGAAKEYDNTINKKILNNNRSSFLENENIELKAKVLDLEEKYLKLQGEVKKDKSKLERYGELSETISEIGVFPR